MKKKRDVRTQDSAQKLAKNFSTYINLPKGVEFLKLEQGKRYKIDIIPYVVSNKDHPLVRDKKMVVGEDYDYMFDFWVHKRIGVDEKQVLCLTTFGKKCPICEEFQRLKEPNPDKELKEILDGLKKKHRAVYYVKNIADGKYCVFEESYFLFHEPLVKAATVVDEGEIISLSDEEDIKTVKFIVSKGSLSDKYNEYDSVDISSSKEKYTKKDLDDAVKLDSIFNVLDYEDLKAMHEGEDTEETSDDEDDEPAEQETAKEKLKREIQEKREKLKAKKNKDKDEGNKCPGGHTYGTDHDDHKECDECAVWEECMQFKPEKKDE